MARCPAGGTRTFGADLRVGPGGTFGAEEALPALSIRLCGVRTGAEPACVTGVTARPAAQARHGAIGAWGAGLPGQPRSFRAVETCEGGQVGPKLGPEEAGRLEREGSGRGPGMGSSPETVNAGQ